MNVVLDTNVVVSAIISPNGSTARIIDAWRSGRLTWILSPPLLAELRRVLRDPKLDRYVKSRRREVDEFVAEVAAITTIVDPREFLSVIESDESDNRVLEAAEEGAADYIVSGDKDLLGLGSYQGMEIVTPARFLAILAST